MKNFPSTLIKQKNTKGIIGNNLGTTLKNIGKNILSNVINSGTVSIRDLENNFDAGYEILDLEHEIDNIDINKSHRKLSETTNGTDVDKLINKYNNYNNLKPNLYNGKQYTYVVSFEDPFKFSSQIFSVINNYKYIMKSTIGDIYEYPRPIEEGSYTNVMTTIHTAAAPSLFNPYQGVNVTGITEYVPLVFEVSNNSENITLENGFGDISKLDKEEQKIKLTSMMQTAVTPKDTSDCTIKTLVELSKTGPEKSPLGLATYRYADFMFCKDLGKISNNHLITLRRFPGPIGDNIFEGSFSNVEKDNIFQGYPDLGRLITWFGNEENKLEDICKFNYNATWKEFHAEIQQKSSEQKDDGILDKIANTFSPQNNRLIGSGFSSNLGLLKWGASAVKIPFINSSSSPDPGTAPYNWELLSNYDQNRIYEPQNRIWDTHKYEGKLVFNQEITLTFRYVLRGYANINPKSAFLDLIGNILTVTYRRGSFWGGETKIYGPQGNNSVYKTANAWIDKGFEKLGGIWNLFMSEGFGINELQGWLGNIMDLAKEGLSNAMGKAGEVIGATENTAANTVSNGQGNGTQGTQGNQGNQGTQGTQGNNGTTSGERTSKMVKKGMLQLAKYNRQYGWTDAIKGMFKNQLGRPAMYAFNSLLSGEAVGPWHLTIGNPRNPIMSMGNMIMTNAEITHSGPLGIDDFPTEIKVTVQLKHGRPRDSVEIQKMYTKGRTSIYHPMNLMALKNFKNNPNAFGDVIDPITSKTYLSENALNKILRNI